MIVYAVGGVSEQAGLDTVRVKQCGDAIEAPLKGRKRLARHVCIQQRKALEGRKSPRSEALPSEPEPNASGEAGGGADGEVGAIRGGRGRRCSCRAFTQVSASRSGKERSAGPGRHSGESVGGEPM